jgi:hypothetical protein
LWGIFGQSGLTMNENTEDKQNFYEEIKTKYLSRHATEREKSIDQLFIDLLRQDLRPLIIIGAAYIEELCKECFLNSLKFDSRKKITEDHSRELTFSFVSGMLWSQNYISEDIYNLITHLRKVRNKMAHNAILEQSDNNFIESKSKDINTILSKGWMTRHPDGLKSMNSVNSSYFIAIENLCFGLMGLSMWIIPEQKLGKLTFISGQNFLRVSIDIASFDYRTIQYFDRKYEIENKNTRK